jgi:DNA-binding response OmpR family regulator
MGKLVMGKKLDRSTSVLVVEFDPEMLQLLRRTLETEGFKTDCAADSLQGLALLKKNVPDVILLDIMMPFLEGYPVIESIREHCDAPVIMAAARREADSLDQGMTLGADDCVEKPFHPLEIVARIKSNLRYRDYWAKLREIELVPA